MTELIEVDSDHESRHPKNHEDEDSGENIPIPSARRPYNAGYYSKK